MASQQTHPPPPANKRVAEVKGSASGGTRQHKQRVGAKLVKPPSVLDPIRRQVMGVALAPDTPVQAAYDASGLAKLGKLADTPIAIQLGAPLDLQNGSGNFFKPHVGSSSLQDALAQLEKEDPFWTAPTDHAASEMRSMDCNLVSCTYPISRYFAHRREDLGDVKALRLHRWRAHQHGRHGAHLAKRARNDRSGWFNYHAYNYEKETLEWIADVIDNQNLVANKILASELTTALYFMHCSLAIQRLHKTTAPIPVLVFTYSHIAATTWTRISEFVFDNVSKTMTIRQSIASKIPQKYDDPIVHNIVRWMFPSRVVAAAAAAPGASTGASGALPHNVISGRATPTAQGSHGQTQTSSPPRATATPPPQQRQQGSTSHRGIPSRTAGSPSASSRPSSHASSTNSRPPSQASNQGTGKRPGPGELGYRI